MAAASAAVCSRHLVSAFARGHDEVELEPGRRKNDALEEAVRVSAAGEELGAAHFAPQQSASWRGGRRRKCWCEVGLGALVVVEDVHYLRHVHVLDVAASSACARQASPSLAAAATRRVLSGSAEYAASAAVHGAFAAATVASRLVSSATPRARMLAPQRQTPAVTPG
jgi:hypothetical protein